MVLEKSMKQPNKVSLGLGLVLRLGLALGLMPSSDSVLYSTVLSSSCAPIYDAVKRNSAEDSNYRA